MDRLAYTCVHMQAGWSKPCARAAVLRPRGGRWSMHAQWVRFCAHIRARACGQKRAGASEGVPRARGERRGRAATDGARAWGGRRRLRACTHVYVRVHGQAGGRPRMHVRTWGRRHGSSSGSRENSQQKQWPRAGHGAGADGAPRRATWRTAGLLHGRGVRSAPCPSQQGQKRCWVVWSKRCMAL